MFFIDNLLWSLFCYISTLVGMISLGTYLLGVVLQQLAMRFPQNLKKKYNAEWALVTGASSGIGKAIAEKLAEQEINVVLVALDDPFANKTFAELQQKYPKQNFRKVGVDLGDGSMKYMTQIIEATKDIEINLLFNNAGYISTGLFEDALIERLRANVECNSSCVIPITHHFLRKMMERGRRGLVTFTSSSACYLPSPTASMYGPSKAFLTNFATSLASEVHDIGIDVVVIHPSPVNTNFFKTQGPSLDSLKMAQKAAGSPMNIANQIFASAGRLTVWDQGVTSAGLRFVNRLLDFPILSELVVRFACLNGDHKKLAASSNIRAKKNK
ncbi:putative short-chain dehydrogenase [Trypanosoma theileri]|uniref:Putative short-chain dehydrogenase n=1 Tax=Trypanosoma theileri TaxID=67003 RepID=A0A1X0P1C4_9TRYP|nr:putative short-chain dehydrogenase [Trypanosoma theileri]ORC90621.1 putative short-chain dehydrogenase [Trypanosoma theileri]